MFSQLSREIQDELNACHAIQIIIDDASYIWEEAITRPRNYYFEAKGYLGLSKYYFIAEDCRRVMCLERLMISNKEPICVENLGGLLTSTALPKPRA